MDRADAPAPNMLKYRRHCNRTRIDKYIDTKCSDERRICIAIHERDGTFHTVTLSQKRRENVRLVVVAHRYDCISVLNICFFQYYCVEGIAVGYMGIMQHWYDPTCPIVIVLNDSAGDVLHFLDIAGQVKTDITATNNGDASRCLLAFLVAKRRERSCDVLCICHEVYLVTREHLIHRMRHERVFAAHDANDTNVEVGK